MPEEKSHHNPQSSPPVEESMTADQAKEELQQAIQGSNEILAQATTTLALFPDTMIIDRAKVTITKRTFFRSAEIMSIRIEDVLNATCTVGPILGTVKMASRALNTEQPAVSIGKFWRNDAKKLKRVLQGYVIALQRSIDCSALGTKELSKMLEELGADNHQGSST